MKKVNYFWGILLIAVLTLGLNGAVYAIPCGFGGVSGSILCSDGPPGDVNDEVADLISGNYFGFDDWEFLQKQETPGEQLKLNECSRSSRKRCFSWIVGLFLDILNAFVCIDQTFSKNS